MVSILFNIRNFPTKVMALDSETTIRWKHIAKAEKVIA